MPEKSRELFHESFPGASGPYWNPNQSTWTYSIPSWYETIDGRNGYGRVNPVRHHRIINDSHPTGLFIGRPNGSSSDVHALNNMFMGPPISELQDRIFFGRPFFPYYREVEEKLAGLENSANILPFIAELLGMKPPVRSVRKNIDRLFNTVRNAILRPDRALLGLDFGILPTFSDIKNIMDQVTSLHERWERLHRNAAHKPQRLQWRVEGDFNTHFDKTVWDMHCRCRIRGRFQANTTIIASYGYFPNSPLGAFAYALSSFGVDDILSSPWELIPFSFILDWFVGFGSFLESIEPSSFSLNDMTIIEQYASVKCIGTYTHRVHLDNYWQGSPWNGKELYSGSFKSYKRFPFWTLPTAPRSGSGLSPRRILQGGALGTSRVF